MRGYLRIFMIVAGILATSSVACSNSIDIAREKESQTEKIAGNDSDPYASRIPIDFSMVGYRASDKAIPDIPVTAIVEAPADGSDATSLIWKRGRQNIRRPLSLF